MLRSELLLSELNFIDEGRLLNGRRTGARMLYVWGVDMQESGTKSFLFFVTINIVNYASCKRSVAVSGSIYDICEPLFRAGR